MRNSTPFHLRFWFSIRTFRRMSKICLLPTVYGRFSSFPWLSLCVVLFSSFLLLLVWLKLASPLSFAARSVSSWTTPKAVNFIIISLVPSCTWNALRDFFPFLNRQLNGMTQWANPLPVPGVQIQPNGTFTHLFRCHPLPQYPQWHLMGAFPPTWFWTLNQIFALFQLPAVHVTKKVTQPLPQHSAIRSPTLALHQLQFHVYRNLTLLVWRPGQQLLYPFGQNNVPTTLMIHNRRRNNVRKTLWSIRRHPNPSLYQLLTRFLLKASIQMIQMKKWCLESTQSILRQQSKPAPWPSLPPYQLTAQFHQLQELQLQSPFQKVLHPTLPFESFNPQNLIGTPLIRLSDLGQELKTKNWSISKMTVNHARRGSRSVPDYDEIHRYAKSAGTSWSRCPTSMARKRLGTNRRQRTKRPRKKKDAAPSCRYFDLLICSYHSCCSFPFLSLCLFSTTLSLSSHYGSSI